VLAGRQLSEVADDAWFDATLHGPDHVREMTTVGRTMFDGHPAYQVKVVLLSGNEETEYFDADTGLQIGSEASRATAQGVVATTNVLRDYRKFGDLLQAATFVQRALGFEQVVTIATCEYNTVSDATFDPPPDVRALVGR
jgi:hypothetical protein